MYGQDYRKTSFPLLLASKTLDKYTNFEDSAKCLDKISALNSRTVKANFLLLYHSFFFKQLSLNNGNREFLCPLYRLGSGRKVGWVRGDNSVRRIGTE